MIVLYVGTQLAASLITMVGGDKNQQRIMLALPFIFVPFIATFEAGLILYWVTTNFWTVGQQLVVRKLYPKPVIEKELKEAGGGGKKPAVAAAVADGGNGKSSSSSVRAAPEVPAQEEEALRAAAVTRFR